MINGFPWSIVCLVCHKTKRAVIVGSQKYPFVSCECILVQVTRNYFWQEVGILLIEPDLVFWCGDRLDPQWSSKKCVWNIFFSMFPWVKEVDVGSSSSNGLSQGRQRLGVCRTWINPALLHPIFINLYIWGQLLCRNGDNYYSIFFLVWKKAEAQWNQESYRGLSFQVPLPNAVLQTSLVILAVLGTKGEKKKWEKRQKAYL